MFNWFRRSSKSADIAAGADRRRDPRDAARGASRSGKPRSRSAARRPGRPVEATAAPQVVPAPVPVLPGGAGTGRPSAPALPATAARLCPDAQRILASLPGPILPRQACERYPQVLDKLFVLWRRPADFRTTLDGLLMDSRGGRQGFPFDVVTELSALREYYDLYVNPVRTSAWGSTTVR